MEFYAMTTLFEH